MRDDESPEQNMRSSAGDHPASAESYLLRDLDDAQRAAFEVHMLDCFACAQDVLATAEFLSAARAAMANEGPSTVRTQHPSAVARKRRRGPLTLVAALSAVPLVSGLGDEVVVV